MWSVVAAVIGGILSLLNALALFSLNRLNSRLDKQDDRIKEVELFSKDLAKCQVDCSRTYVSKEDWVRSEAFTRNKLDGVAGTLNRIEGKIEIVTKLPEIAGAIAREIIGGKK